MGFLLPHQSLELNRKELTQYLEEIAHSDRLQGIDHQTLVIDGDTAGVIVDTALAEDADLIVMSTHGRSGFSRWMMGSVTAKVVRAAHCPVYVVRDGRDIERMVITVDGSKPSEGALNPGFRIAQLHDCSVTLLEVLDFPVDVAGALSERSRQLMQYSDEHRQNVVHHAETYVESLIKKYAPEGLDVEAKVFESPMVAEGILEFVSNTDTDLLVMATHGHTGLKRWAYGSVTEKVIHDAKCDLMIVHLPKDQLREESDG